MSNKYQWYSSKPTLNGNVYNYYPIDEDFFKEEVAKKGGMIVEIYDNEKIIEKKQTKSKYIKWTSPVFTYLKTMTTNGIKFEKYYKNCYFYAYPIGY